MGHAAKLVTTLLSTTLTLHGEMTPFVIPLDQHPESRISFKAEPITPKSPRITLRDGHFSVNRRALRIWGVNCSFGANLPSHADAERVAARLEAAGVNSLRFHHMDTRPFPRGLLDPQDSGKLSPEALDRLDYFIDQLARQGIYANLNLHVGRAPSQYLKLPDPGTPYDKIVGLFTPLLVDAQKQYARDLLTHLNPYRNMRLADDPAVAFVEITNEDSLFMWGADEDLRALPPYYNRILTDLYNAWLKKQYGSTPTLRKTWAPGSEPLGSNLLAPTRFPPPSDSKTVGWRLEQHESCKADVHRQGPSGFRLAIGKADDTAWHLQMKQTPLVLTAGQYYTLSFRAKADHPRSLFVSVGQDQTPWNNLGLSAKINLTSDWIRVCLSFTARTSDATARLSFAFSGSPTSLELSDLSLAPGGREGLRASESLEQTNVALFAEGECEARILDRFAFLIQLERDFFDDLYHFLKKDLGVKALVTGTTVFGPGGLYGQSGLDYIDSHAYWQHPQFPGKPWDPGHWIVKQKAMVDHPNEATLPRLAAERLAGKPFTVSEYNHPAPNDFQAECVPMIAAYAAAQDWDGLWLYTYSHDSNDFARTAYNSFFDIDANSAKWGFMQAGASLFRFGGIPPHGRVQTLSLASASSPVRSAALWHRAHDRDLLQVVKSLRETGEYPLFLDQQIQLTFQGPSTIKTFRTHPESHVKWATHHQGLGTFWADAPRGRILVSHEMTTGAVSRAGITLVSPAFAALTLTPLDNRPLDQSAQILITACGRCENREMRFSPNRETVGRNWGIPPVEIEPVTGTVLLPPGDWNCRALRPDGTPGTEIPLERNADGSSLLALSPTHQTMWYWAARK